MQTHLSEVNKLISREDLEMELEDLLNIKKMGGELGRFALATVPTQSQLMAGGYPPQDVAHVPHTRNRHCTSVIVHMMVPKQANQHRCILGADMLVVLFSRYCFTT